MNLTVSKLVFYIKSKLDTDQNLNSVCVTGEISNFYLKESSGHCYFTLKDDKAQISCVMFRSNASKLKFEPNNGDKVIVCGNVSIFESSGSMQLYVNSMKQDGLGDLYLKYEELKKKLDKEGLFAEEAKKELKTKFIEKVAVLVGDKSAAMSDIKTCFNRRWPLANVDYYPVLVQGNDAPKDIINSLITVDSMNYDAIILARGGGSFEDLFCFNDEQLVRCIYDLKTFIITGIGHEQDFTLCDFVADLRAPTPTASVELITNNIVDIRNEVNRLSNSKYLINPKYLIERKSLLLDFYFQKLNSFSKKLNNYRSTIDANLYSMSKSLINRINSINISVNQYTNSLNHSIDLKLVENINLVKRYTVLLNAYSKENVLKRGFSLTYKDSRLIKSIKDIKKNDEIDIVLKDGTFKAEVI